MKMRTVLFARRGPNYRAQAGLIVCSMNTAAVTGSTSGSTRINYPEGYKGMELCAGGPEKGRRRRVEVHLRPFGIEVLTQWPAVVVGLDLARQRVKKSKALVIEFLERQLHVGGVVLVIVVIAPVMPGEECEEVNAWIDRPVLYEMCVEYGYLDQLVQRGNFAHHDHDHQVYQDPFHQRKGRRVLPMRQVIPSRFYG